MPSFHEVSECKSINGLNLGKAALGVVMDISLEKIEVKKITIFSIYVNR